jgi:hypothetical protein
MTTITVPNEGETTIADNAYQGRQDLVNVIIRDGVTSIGDTAFSGCS